MTSLSNIGPSSTKKSWKARARGVVPSKRTPRTSTSNVAAFLAKTSGGISDRTRRRDQTIRTKILHPGPFELPHRIASSIETHARPRRRGSRRRRAVEVGGAAAVGVASMYLLDPDRGSARRARLRDQAFRLRRRAGDNARGLTRDLRRRTIGVGLRYRFTGRDVDDTVLTERVRSQLGMATGHAKAIDVAVSDRHVHLSGDVLADEHDAVVRSVSRTPGVRDVDDRITVHESAERVFSLQGAGN